MNNVYTHLHTSLDGLHSWLGASWHHWTTWSVDKVVHLIPSKCSFDTCPYTIMLSFTMTSLKEIPTMFNVCFLIKVTQPVEWSRKFQIDLSIHMTISNVHWIWSYKILMNHKFYQDNVVQNVYHVYIHHWHKINIL